RVPRWRPVHDERGGQRCAESNQRSQELGRRAVLDGTWKNSFHGDRRWWQRDIGADFGTQRSAHIVERRGANSCVRELPEFRDDSKRAIRGGGAEQLRAGAGGMGRAGWRMEATDARERWSGAGVGQGRESRMDERGKDDPGLATAAKA